MFTYNVCRKCAHYKYNEEYSMTECPLMNMFILYSAATGDHMKMMRGLCDGRKCAMFKNSNPT